MRIAALLALMLPPLLWGASVESKIAKSKRELQKTERRISGLNTELKKIAREIRALQKELASLDKKIASVDAQVQKLSKEHQIKLRQLQEAKSSVEQLSKKHELLRRQLSKAIAKSFSKSLLLGSLGEAQEEDLIKEQILRSIQKQEQRRLEALAKDYSRTAASLKEQQKLIEKLKSQIDDLVQQKLKLKTLREKKSAKVEALAKKRRSYDAQLQRLTQQRQSLNQTLRRLQILKSQQSRTKKQNKLKVKNYGAYSFDRTVRYKGPKTIAPLKEFVITKKYGLYKDPIYNIEIPNENIELKPLRPGAKVRNVLNGRVVLAKHTPHLKYVVIVKHDGGLHTIYANIDKLSPYVKKGKRIKKGYILGKVNNKLIFEVTKDQSHINPLDLIRVK